MCSNEINVLQKCYCTLFSVKWITSSISLRYILNITVWQGFYPNTVIEKGKSNDTFKYVIIYLTIYQLDKKLMYLTIVRN